MKEELISSNRNKIIMCQNISALTRYSFLSLAFCLVSSRRDKTHTSRFFSTKNTSINYKIKKVQLINWITKTYTHTVEMDDDIDQMDIINEDGYDL